MLLQPLQDVASCCTHLLTNATPMHCSQTGFEVSDNQPTGEIAEAAQSTSASPPRVMLNLRKWYDIKPSYEFRCFVNKRKMVAACQVSLRCTSPKL